jgi:hypothetical protein
MNKKINVEKAIQNLGLEAHKRVLKDEVLKFRLESETLDRLLKLAYKLNTPVGTLVRSWIIERLDEEENGQRETPEIAAISIIALSLAEQGILPDDEMARINKILSGKKRKTLFTRSSNKSRSRKSAAR